jgi:hypothetical protein
MLVYVTNCRVGGWGGGKLSFQCLRPSASLRAAGKNHALAESLLSRVFSWDVVDVGFLTCFI